MRFNEPEPKPNKLYCYKCNSFDTTKGPIKWNGFTYAHVDLRICFDTLVERQKDQLNVYPPR